MVAEGLTDQVPPALDIIVYLLPSDPVIVTFVLFVALTVKTEEPPGVMVVGFAAIVTVGADTPPLLWGDIEPEQPATLRQTPRAARMRSGDMVGKE